MDLGHTALLAGPQLADERDHVEAELALGQHPGAQLLRHIGAMILRTRPLATGAHMQRQPPEPIQADHRPAIRVGHPHEVPALPAVLPLRHELLLLPRRGSPPSPSHPLPPLLWQAWPPRCLLLSPPPYTSLSSTLYRPSFFELRLLF